MMPSSIFPYSVMLLCACAAVASSAAGMTIPQRLFMSFSPSPAIDVRMRMCALFGRCSASFTTYDRRSVMSRISSVSHLGWKGFFQISLCLAAREHAKIGALGPPALAFIAGPAPPRDTSARRPASARAACAQATRRANCLQSASGMSHLVEGARAS
ncbi:exported protein of unknown function [Burkholderia multivorans]